MDILGTGNALVDIFWFSDDESALSLGLHPNRSAHVSAERMDELLLAVAEPIRVAGGSASNALKVASALGADTAFVGCVGTDDREDDADATLFRGELSSFGVACKVERRTGATGRCLVIHMPGGLKSVACAPSAASLLSPDQIDEALVADAKLVLVDGPILRNAVLLDRIASLCRAHGVTIALDGGSAELMRHHRDVISSLLETNKTILLLNSDEAAALADALALEDALDDARSREGSRDAAPADDAAPTRDAGDGSADGRSVDETFARLARAGSEYPCIVEKRGALGARAWRAGERFEDGGVPAEAVLDDTGAGDAFNGAFLACLLRNVPMKEALAFANETARCALGVPGTNLDRDRLRELRSKLDSSTR